MSEVISWIGGICITLCFGGWGLYLTTERGRIVGDIKEMKKTNEHLESRISSTREAMAAYWLKTDHVAYEDRVTQAINRLSDRIDKVLEEVIHKRT